MDALGMIALLLLAVGAFASLLLAVPALIGGLDTTRWVQLDLGLLLFVALGSLAVYASQEDGYYGSGVSRWEHGTRFVGGNFLVVTLALGVAATIGLWIVSFLPGRWRRLGVPLALVASVVLSLSWFSMTGGH